MFGGEAPSYICWGHNNRSRDDPGADVQAAQGPVDPHRAAHHRRRVQPLPRVRGRARGRHEGHRGGLRAAARGRGRRLVAHRARAHAASASSRCPRASTRRSRSPSSSELLAETLGEHVFDFFLRNKRAEWDEYRGQVSAFERDRMLPVAVDGRHGRLQPGPGQPAAHRCSAIVVAHRRARRRPRGVHPGRRRRTAPPASFAMVVAGLLLGSAGSALAAARRTPARPPRSPSS